MYVCYTYIHIHIHTGVRSLCIHVEWKGEEGVSDAAERWHAVRSRPGGVQGVVVLALRAPAVVREEKRVMAETEAAAEAARQEVWRKLMEEEMRKKQVCQPCSCWLIEPFISP
jgi:hypothetical protein